MRQIYPVPESRSLKLNRSAASTSTTCPSRWTWKLGFPSSQVFQDVNGKNPLGNDNNHGKKDLVQAILPKFETSRMPMSSQLNAVAHPDGMGWAHRHQPRSPDRKKSAKTGILMKLPCLGMIYTTYFRWFWEMVHDIGFTTLLGILLRDQQDDAGLSAKIDLR